ncbi:Hypothetical predicted protein [Mytilus galloprovincialis]|uniref:Uncharacterized protein n=1 Tax=Mytilus galloprovincialis TaxID=29158 RepID=A0A8B6G5B4_MYTGA|nr:Hypothetical predicted protein [Mytilus galloprovincialis]
MNQAVKNNCLQRQIKERVSIILVLKPEEKYKTFTVWTIDSIYPLQPSMNRNSKNVEDDNEQNVHGLKKITYWEKYGVKRFPYSGRRRYSPCVYQSEDGGIIISNDVFGLTIKQVERTYKECLDRRKAHEQYILNIRYPDKTSTEYMEYLENSRYCQGNMANMNKNSRNHNKNDGQNVHGLRKVAFWEKYGAKRFPYRGSRRYTPFVLRSEDGGIVISNDVFGLTIRQFERIYKDCLDRRKTKEQFILNLRYPDKTSDEYLEYLENSTHDNKDYLSCPANDLKKRYLHVYLMETLGTEIDIRKRQKLFIIKDMIQNTNKSIITKISSGSLGEGLDLPGSDVDIMHVLKNVDVIQKVRDIKFPIQRTTLQFETDTDHPGFAKLRLIALTNRENNHITYKCFESTKTGLYLSANEFNDNGRCRLLRTNNESSFIKLDLLYYGTCFGEVISDLSQCLQTLMFIKSLITSEYSTFIIDVCKYLYAEINQYAAQLLQKPSTTITTNTYNLHKRYHRHLQDGINTDAVSGWLLYASFYYVTGQFEVTLRLTDYILSKFLPGMLFLGCGPYNDKDVNNYKRHIVHHSMTQCDRMKIGTVSCVEYLKNSSLIPRELKHVVICDAGDIYIPPIVMSHCLRFLCFHHLRYISNRKESLHDLYLVVTDKNHVPSNILSDALLVLGVCFQISGDKDAAHQCFDKALKCEGFVGPSAETREARLLKM